MTRARLSLRLSARKALISSRLGTTPTVSSVTRRRKARSSLRPVISMRSTLSSGQTAPSRIQRSRMPTCSLFSGWPFGGMMKSSSVLTTRAISELFSGWPGTTAGPSDSPPLRASASESSLRSPLVLLPWWQLKQLASRIGSTSL